MKGMKIGTLFLVLMVGMAAVGASYALWSKTITLSGSVATGKVDMEWSTFTDDDNGIDPGYDKNVADCTVTTTPGLVTVTITNGYPSYTCTIVGDIHNSGTIPIKLKDFVYTVPAGIKVTPSTGFIDPLGVQLDPSQTLVGDFKIHVEQEAAQSSDYTFSIEATGQQWNEFP